MDAEGSETVLDRLDAHSTEESRLLSVYVPPSRLVDRVIVFLDDEHEEAEGIESEDRREGVRRTIVRLQDRLAEYDTVPDNGLALFCGRVDDEWIEATLESPPRPVETFRYRCGREFLVEAYRELLAG